MKVFWSWQSDHPGNISRHFVRGALEAAIGALNATPEIADAERPSEVSLDHDRKGVPGSPDLARVIFEKIAASQVFVADVTPVGKTPGKTAKKLINSNVAIELGYALAAVTDRGLLMVLNEHFGTVENLPFDLRHKAGPITYRLAPEASRDEILGQRAQVVGRLKAALRDILKDATIRAARTQSFVAQSALPDNRAQFIPRGKVLLARETTHHAMPIGPLLYLRLIPSQVLPPLKRAAALELAQRHEDLGLLYPRAGVCGTRANEFGALTYGIDDGHLQGATQLFMSREFWGFDAAMLGDRDKPRGFPTLALERTFADGLARYVRFATKKLDLSPPFTIEAGATGVDGFVLNMPPQYSGQRWGPVMQNPIVWKGVLASDAPRDIDQVLLAIFEEFFDAVGEARPVGLYNFPGTTPGSLPQRN